MTPAADADDCLACADLLAVVRATGRPQTCAACGAEFFTKPAETVAVRRAELPVRTARVVRFVTIASIRREGEAPGIDGLRGDDAPRDADLVKLRAFVSSLRPDFADPWKPLASDVTAPPPAPKSDRAPWDFLAPPGYGQSWNTEALASNRPTAQAIVDKIRALPPDASAVCRWLRYTADVTPAGCVHKIRVAIGERMADAVQRARWGLDRVIDKDTTPDEMVAIAEAASIRRVEAPIEGKRLLAAARVEWERGAK